MMKANESMTVASFVGLCHGLDREEILGRLEGVLLTDADNLLDLLDVESLDRDDVKAIMGTQEAIREFERKSKSLKKPSPVSRAQWLAGMAPFAIELGDQELVVKPKEFKTGSFGSYGQGIHTLVVDGVEVPCRVSVNVVVQNSKYAS